MPRFYEGSTRLHGVRAQVFEVEGSMLRALDLARVPGPWFMVYGLVA